MASPIDPVMAELEFLISLLGNTPKTRNLSATKQKIVMNMEHKRLVASRLPDTYPSPDDFVFLTEKGKEILTRLGEYYTVVVDQS